MPYLPDLHTYLHNSSLLIQAYSDTRITTKYSLPRKPNTKTKSNAPSKHFQKASDAASDQPAGAHAADSQHQQQQREKKEPSASLTLKTYHPGSGICLKYRTDKAQEVGRLMAGLGRLAKGEVIDMPTAATATTNAGIQIDGDAMEVDSGSAVAPKMEDKVVTGTPAAQQTQQQGQQAGGGGGGGGKKKKKGKK